MHVKEGRLLAQHRLQVLVPQPGRLPGPCMQAQLLVMLWL